MPPRPVPYGEEERRAFQDEIVEWISEGKTLRAYCRQQGKPSWKAVYLWLDQDPDFATRFARSRELGFDAIAQEVLEIADTPQDGVVITDGPEGKTIRHEDMLGHRKLQVETRLKLLAKWDPKRYGDRVESRDPLRVQLPPIRSAADLPAAFAAIATALRDGQMSAGELETVHKVLSGYRTAFGEAEFARELAEMREQIQAMKSTG